MADNIYIDNVARKRIVTYWIPVCLIFLHVWSSLLIAAMIVPAIKIGTDIITLAPYPQAQLDTIYKAFKTCQFAIWGLILLLISDKALEFMIERAGNIAGAAVGNKTVQTTTTTEQKTIVTPPVPTVEIAAENVNVNSTK